MLQVHKRLLAMAPYKPVAGNTTLHMYILSVQPATRTIADRVGGCRCMKGWLQWVPTNLLQATRLAAT